ncbi:MAG: hypothetical protein AAB448_00220 [Patescibacteria group bacterium]
MIIAAVIAGIVGIAALISLIGLGMIFTFGVGHVYRGLSRS